MQGVRDDGVQIVMEEVPRQDWRIQWKASAKRLKIKGAVERPKGRLSL
jgi:phenylpyruvate tautomerase PptA (4-oxalocrotonate tautomerase family)